MSKQKSVCVYCNNDIIANVPRKYCNKKCEGCDRIGDKNPNFGGKGWTEEKRQKQREQTLNRLTIEMRFKIGSANRGKKFSKERIHAMHVNRSKESYSHKHSEESKILISKKSKEKFTKDYKIKQRKIMEERGYWIPLKDKNDYEIYFKQADWIEKMFDKILDTKQIKLLSSLGIFNAKNNPKGVVRDHKLSRKTGFNKKIFPELLRHPCNCQILTHSENVKKKKTRYIDNDHLTIEELFKDICSFKGEWKEQKNCLQLIEDYNNGLRWIRKEY